MFAMPPPKRLTTTNASRMAGNAVIASHTRIKTASAIPPK